MHPSYASLHSEILLLFLTLIIHPSLIRRVVFFHEIEVEDMFGNCGSTFKFYCDEIRVS